MRGLANQLGFGRRPAIVGSSIAQCPSPQPPKCYLQSASGADWRTLARLRNVALYCSRHIVQCNANCLRAEPLLGVGTAISAEVNRSGKIKKSVALVLCQLRWRQLHRLLREPDAAALSVAPNGSGGARYQESKALAHRRCP